MVDQHQGREQHPASDNSPVGTGTYSQIRGDAPRHARQLPYPLGPCWIYPAAGLLVQLEGDERGGRRGGGAGALVRRAGPGRNPAGAASAARGRPGPGARALQRDQPGHRGADRRRPGARERIPAHARAVHGRQLPVPGEIRLRHGRRGRGRARRRWSAAMSLRCIPIRPSSTCRPRRWCRCRPTFRCRARCWRPTWRRR